MGRAVPTRQEVLTPVLQMTARRKARIILALKSRLVTLEEAMAAHNISREEMRQWLVRHAQGGQRGLMFARRKQRRALTPGD